MNDTQQERLDYLVEAFKKIPANTEICGRLQTQKAKDGFFVPL